MITEAEAIRIAKQLAQENAWAWDEPVQAVFRRTWLGKPKRWEIYSNANKLGAKVRVFIDAISGVVLDKGYISR